MQNTDHLVQLNIYVVDKWNIDSGGFGIKGLHLNSSGKNRLAKKFYECN